MPKPRLIAIIGPTAAGKTDYGIQMAQRLNGSVVSADSRQVYRGMNVGSAKPREAWLAAAHGLDGSEIVSGIPHYLLNIREPNQPMTLPEWQEAAFAAIDMILAEGKQPILVGGTMLYVDSIVLNFHIPRVAPDAEFRKSKIQSSKSKMYEELLEKDPGAGKFIEPGNTRRIIRALEVMAATGKPFSLQRQQRESRYEVEMIGLSVEWDELTRRIEARAMKMFEEGLLEETQALRAKYPIPPFGWNWSQTMHYRQAGAVLDGEMSEAEAIKSMAQDNLRYAHRQMSWWRNRKDIEWRQ